MKSFILFGWIALLLCATSTAADQTVTGAGNQQAAAIALKSPLVRSAMDFLVREAQQITDKSLREATLDILDNPRTCVAHRTNLSSQDRKEILQKLGAAQLIDPAYGSRFPGGLEAGVFPPLANQEQACPHLPQPFEAAPGSFFDGHHSYPGGLAIHEAFNEMSDLSLADDYRRLYGHLDSRGLPVLNREASGDDLQIDQDIIIAASIWHDWAKDFVFQWNADGTEFVELDFGGNGATDNYGAKGNSMTGAHHILGIAEAIKRGLRPDFVVALASAHSAPAMGNEYKVANWIRAASIIARIDPVAKGYLTVDAEHHLRLPPLAALGSFDARGGTPPEPFFLPEDTIHNLSDGNFFLAMPATIEIVAILRKLAPEFGYPAGGTAFNTSFRNPTLSYETSERLMFIYARKGLAGVRKQLLALRKSGLI